MKKLALLLGVAFSATFLGSPRALAQWQTVTYTLRGGWNAIYLHGEATHATLDAQLADHPSVRSVWRWNPNPEQAGFLTTPLLPGAGTPEWSVWTRGDPAGSTLSVLDGRSAYLVECLGAATDTISLPITQRVLPPRATWVRDGANLIGFPTRKTGSAYPAFSTYFATFPTALASGSRVYRYAGGPLGAANPVQLFSTTSERVDRDQAYWFEAPVVGDFYAPLEITASLPEGLAFGRAGSLITVRVRNRSSAPISVGVAPVASAPAPAGQDPVVGPVPLLRRVFVAASASYETTALGAGFTETIAPQATTELSFLVDRSAMTGAADAFYASLLRFTDGSNLIDISLPVSARVGTLAGLWVGDISLSGVQSKAPGATGSATARPLPLRVLLHVDDAGVARLLSQVFVGRLAAAPESTGLCLRESALLGSAKADAARYVAGHLPLDRALSAGSGSVALGATLVRTVDLPFDDPVNPFVHAYHPDHDNLDARRQPLPAGVESYAVRRVCAFTFAPAPIAGAPSVGWGSTVLGGTYSETITGLHKDPLAVTGTFLLRRVNESGAITLN